VGTDSTTQGNWVGTYGTDGYSLAAGASAVPSYVTATMSGATTLTWSSSANSDPRALQVSGGQRLAAAWHGTIGTGNADGSFTVDLNFTDGGQHRLSAYLLDYNKRNRGETVQVLNANTGAVLDTRSVSDFTGGKYLTWTLSGHVRLRFANSAGSLNAVLSGLFFA
jgi:hypothetical protein